MTFNSPEPTPLSHWLRRLWPVYCFFAALVTFGYALYSPYQIDGDAVSYMDIGDLIRAHNWNGVINGYWNPLYPAALSLGHIVFHPARLNELHAYYMVNFGIFLLEMFAIVAFADAIVSLRDLRENATASANPLPFLLDRYALRYLGVGLVIISTQRELNMGRVGPDALLQAFLLLGVTALLRHLGTGYLRYAALMGFALGLAYLSKSFAFVFTFVCILTLIAFRMYWQRHSAGRVGAAALVVFVCFSLVAGPYIAALSRQKGYLDFGDSGGLNYAWFVSGTEKMHLQPNEPNLFGAADVHLVHPNKQLLQSPPVYSYAQLPYGTYPDWFDASFWNDRIKAHMNPRLEIGVIRDCIIRIFRYMANHPEAWLLLLLLLLIGARFRPRFRVTPNAFWLVPIFLGLAILGIYSIVNIEDRYITVGFLTLLLPLFAALRIAPSVNTISARNAASAAVAMLALLAAGESARIVGQLRRDLVFIHYPNGWYDHDTFLAAHALNDLGVGPGDTIACIGTRACLYDHYWARLAGVRILTEVYEPDAPLYPHFAAIPNRSETYEVLRQQGAKVLVGYFDPGDMTGKDSVSAGWVQLGPTPFYALPLNLPNPTNQAASDPSRH
jgi:hypothetical protein